MRNKIKYLLFAFLACQMLPGCGGPDLVTAVDGSEGPLVIYPDYKDVTIPTSIAPLNFRYAMPEVRHARTTFILGDKSVTLRGTEVEWRLGQWKAFLADAAGQTVTVKAEAVVNGQKVSDQWSIFVSEDPMDGWLTYRLIEPSYQMYNEVSIRERCVETFEETVLCDHRVTDNACMNCHVHGQSRGDYSLYYIRGPQGGSILNQNGKLRKLSLKTDDMLSATVYGELHPDGRFGVFSTNIILPSFHTLTGMRMEVFDTGSDLTVADFENNRMINVPHVARSDKFETFPCFSADGHSVYYCVVADYGTFPLFHPECALYLADLQSGEIRPMNEIKGNKSDSYHSWSSNSRWFVFASKRGDGQYGKPYFCHLDADGRTTKPFVLPQESSRFYLYNLKSFNVPDLGNASTGMTVKDARRMFKAESEIFQ